MHTQTTSLEYAGRFSRAALRCAIDFDKGNTARAARHAWRLWNIADDNHDSDMLWQLLRVACPWAFYGPSANDVFSHCQLISANDVFSHTPADQRVVLDYILVPFPFDADDKRWLAQHAYDKGYSVSRARIVQIDPAYVGQWFNANGARCRVDDNPCDWQNPPAEWLLCYVVDPNEYYRDYC